MNKKLLITLLTIIILVVLGLGIYLFFFKKPPTVSVTPDNLNNPFGTAPSDTTKTGSSQSDNSAGDQSSDNSSASNPQDASNPLIKISTAPVAGAEFVDRKIGTTTYEYIRYTDRATGNTYEYAMASSSLVRVSNTTIPQVSDARWIGDNVILRSVQGGANEIVKTFLGTLSLSATATSSLTGSFLPDNIYALAVSPAKDKIFYLTNSQTASGIVDTLATNKKVDIFDYPFNEWSAQWPSATTVALTSKPSFQSNGYLYLLNTVSGTMTKVLGDIVGLTTLVDPSLKYAAYARGGNGLSLNIQNISQNNAVPANVQTLPEKCVWGASGALYCAVPQGLPGASYPDDWYKGNVLFTDDLYKIDPQTGISNFLYKISSQQPIDAINLVVDAKENYLIFTNKQDYFLWSFQLKSVPITAVAH